MQFESSTNYRKTELVDSATADVTIYVRSTGSDTTGTGSVSKPYASIDRAWKDIPIRASYKRTINVGAGSFNLSEDKICSFASPGTGNWHTIVGDTTESTQEEVAAVTSDSASGPLGLAVQVVGAAWGADVHKGALIRWKSGALNTTLSVCYGNTADTLYLTKGNEDFTAASPIATDKFVFVNRNTTINLTKDIAFSLSRASFQYVNLTGNYVIRTTQGNMWYVGCNMALSNYPHGHVNSSVSYRRCYLALDPSTTAAAIMGHNNGAQTNIEYGTVVDAYLAAGNLPLRGSPVHSFQLRGEVLFQNMDCIRLDGTVMVATSTTTIMRVRNSRTVFESANTDGSFDLAGFSMVNLPNVTGTVTGNFMGRYGFGDKIRIDGGVVNTATNPNRWTLDGINESYANARMDAHVHIGTQNHDVVSTASGTLNLQAADNIKASSGMVRVAGQGGAVTLTSNPQVIGGVDGMTVRMLGTSDVNTLTIVDGNGCQLAGGANMALGQGDLLTLIYDAPRNMWIEESRSDN